MRLSTAVRGKDLRFQRSPFPERRDWTTGVGLFFCASYSIPGGRLTAGPARARVAASSKYVASAAQMQANATPCVHRKVSPNANTASRK
jgi:hypothetical protein